MRFSALSIAIIFSATIAHHATANNAFSDVLAELKFAGPSNDAPSVPSYAQARIEELLPAPTGFVLPEAASVSTAKVSLQRPIVNAAAPETQIDMDAAFTAQEIFGSTISANTVGFGHHGLASGCAGLSCDGGCDSACGHGGCESCQSCVAHDDVQLPSSTFLQYFRSNKCNTHVWDGYQQKCGHSHKHVMGECDCAAKSSRGCRLGSAFGSCGEILAPMPRAACGLRKACNCDASHCDSGCDDAGCADCSH